MIYFNWHYSCRISVIHVQASAVAPAGLSVTPAIVMATVIAVYALIDGSRPILPLRPRSAKNLSSFSGPSTPAVSPDDVL